METIDQIHCPSRTRLIGESAPFHFGQLTAPLKLAVACAMAATLTSLIIAMYTGWLGGGLPVERVIRIALISVAVLVVHWLPMGWSAFRGYARFGAFALWIVATTVVLYGQVTFYMVLQQHAGALRAATVWVPPVPTNTNLPAGRSRTEIAKDATKVSTDLARAQARHCVDDCPTLKVRRARLAAEVTALNAEADEAKRREVSEDRRNSQADRIDELHATLRADPVAFPVASWLGMTEHCLELIIGLAYAVVLEGAAIMGWTLVSVGLGRDARRNMIVSDQALGVPDRAPAAEREASRAVLSEDDQLLERIHAAVAAGELKPTQESIRKLLRCGQPKAGVLNRQYTARFGPLRV